MALLGEWKGPLIVSGEGWDSGSAGGSGRRERCVEGGCIVPPFMGVEHRTGPGTY